MLRTGRFADKKILLVDRDNKKENDRTWCFWETTPGYFEEIVYRSWDRIAIHGPGLSKAFPIAPYRYKMIRGADFYRYCFAVIAEHPNVEFEQAAVGNWQETTSGTWIELDGQRADLGKPVLFSAIYKPRAASLQLLQHFKGWIIEAKQPFFDPGLATMMDFRTAQAEGTTFVYVLPLDDRRALVEYTLFSKNKLADAAYDAGLKNYISEQLGLTDYTILETETGVIPMTNEKFPIRENGWLLGTAGGQTKASSGYTYRFIQKQCDRILANLLAGKAPAAKNEIPGRFRFYDNTLLYILYHGKLPGDAIFTRLFKKNKPQQVLRFLDNETTLAEELRLVSSLPVLPFLQAAIRH